MDRDQRGFPQSAYRTAAAPPGVWQSGGLLVMERTAVLPARCIRCNREVSSLWQQEIRVSPLWRAGVFVYPAAGSMSREMLLIARSVTRRPRMPENR